MSSLAQEFEPPTLCMVTKELTLKEFINLSYHNFKDKGDFDDLNDEELTTMLLLESKNLMTGTIYSNHKNQKYKRNEYIKRLFKNLVILTKINEIDLEE